MVGSDIPIIDAQLKNLQLLDSTVLLWTRVCEMFPTSCLTSKTFTSYDLDSVRLTWFQQGVRHNVMWVYIWYGSPRNLKKHTAEWNESISQQMFELDVANCLIIFKNLIKYVSRIPHRPFLFFFPHNICISKAIWTYPCFHIDACLFSASLFFLVSEKYSAAAIKMIICVAAQFFSRHNYKPC